MQEAVTEFAFGHQYAWMIVIYSVMAVYSITCPLVTPFGKTEHMHVLSVYTLDVNLLLLFINSFYYINYSVL
jgi:hypothetical protein